MSIDSSALDSYRDFMGEDADSFIAEVVSSFIESAPQLVTAMEKAIAEEDPKAFVL